jgi:hypothetical protein
MCDFGLLVAQSALRRCGAFSAFSRLSFPPLYLDLLTRTLIGLELRTSSSGHHVPYTHTLQDGYRCQLVSPARLSPHSTTILSYLTRHLLATLPLRSTQYLLQDHSRSDPVDEVDRNRAYVCLYGHWTNCAKTLVDRPQIPCRQTP